MEKEKSGQIPQKGKWFNVNPLEIDKGLFQKRKKDPEQEKTRRLILEAFNEFESNPFKYKRNFRTMVPKRGVGSRPVQQFFDIAEKLGKHNADWVEQALIWAQMIANGETWEAICNLKDNANFYRLVKCKDGYAHRVGGTRHVDDDKTATSVSRSGYRPTDMVYRTRPVIVDYDD